MPLEPFLASVARHYLDELRSGVSAKSFIFPSKRSQTFFRHYLAQLTEDTPIFAPRTLTMSELIQGLYPELKLLDKTALLFELYEAYKEVCNDRKRTSEGFDEFVYWGNIILQDFDTCDRYLINIHHLYSNLRDFKEMTDDFSYLSEEMKREIEQFWGNIPQLNQGKEGQGSEYKTRFLAFWECLEPLYIAFNDRLIQQGYTYEGHLYRLVAEGRDEVVDHLGEEVHLVFVGLFHITEAERKLFRRLRTREKAEFCWDRAVKIVQDELHPAHHYLSNLIKEFGQVRGVWDDPMAPCLPAQVEVIHSASLMAQVKGLPLILDRAEVEPSDEGLTTAIILPDEGLLLPTASSLPETFTHINISLGYPLDRTPIALLLQRWSSLLEFAARRKDYLPSDQLIALLSERLVLDYAPRASELIARIRGQKKFFYPIQELLSSSELSPAPPSESSRSLIHLLLEPVETATSLLDRIQQILEYLILAAQDPVDEEANPKEEGSNSESTEGGVVDQTGVDRLSTFDIEFIYHYLRLVKRLRGLLTPYLDTLKLPTVMNLLSELVHTVTIPFEGDPLRGVQVMGLLETRALHLETMIYLSAQEGVLPPNKYTSTLIPFTLRRGFGLPIGGTDDLGQDYTFFQSISRAKRLIFVVAPAETKRSGGEESRYIGLLRYVYGIDVKVSTLQLSSSRQPVASIQKEKNEAVMEKLNKYLHPEGETLSPSRFNSYISCPLRFYYEVIEGLKEPEEPSIVLQSNDFGTVLHRTMEEVYKRVGSVVTKATLEQMRGQVSSIVKDQYLEVIYPQPLGQTRQRQRKLGGLDLIYCQMIESYVRSILEYDIQMAPFTYLGSEQSGKTTFLLKDGRKVYFKGTIDRMDRLEMKQGANVGEVRIRVVDYKTGGAELKLSSWDKLHDSKYKAIVQTLIYCAFSVSSGQPAQSLYPAIYALRGTEGLMVSTESFDPLVKLPDENEKKALPRPRPYSEVEESFNEFMKKVLSELFDPSVPFRQTEDLKVCDYCPFTSSCGR